jgi:hypothetical protein
MSSTAECGQDRFSAAPPTPDSVRWLARLAVEGREVRLSDLQLAAAALACLRGRRHEQAEKTLLRLL